MSRLRSNAKVIYDNSTVTAMDELISQLNVMIASEQWRCGTSTMVTYHLQRAIEYAEREKQEAITQGKRDED